MGMRQPQVGFTGKRPHEKTTGNEPDTRPSKKQGTTEGDSVVVVYGGVVVVLFIAVTLSEGAGHLLKRARKIFCGVYRPCLPPRPLRHRPVPRRLLDVPVLELDHPRRYLVEKEAVVADHQHRAGEIGEGAFHHLDTRHV